jgi:RND family efflux transporter MFP subunit
MVRKYIVPLVALAGVVFAILTVLGGNETRPPAPPVSAAPRSPYPSSVAGSGIVEASTENISLGTQVSGIVSKIFVAVGSDVKAGDPLFAIDDRTVQAELAIRRAAVQVADAQLADARYSLRLDEPLAAKGLIAAAELQKRHIAAQKAEAQLLEAHAELSASEVELERLTVRAPVDGEVLQLKVHLGELASAGPTVQGQSPLIVLGSVTPLHVRVDVDENDAWRVRGGAPAVGYLRGNEKIETPLAFVRFEPFVVPKRSLTGDSTERVDTRVLQVIFSFTRGDLPIFVGQQMDVYIEAPAASAPPPPEGPGSRVR